jgi:seryl-tRNA synthetase
MARSKMLKAAVKAAEEEEKRLAAARDATLLPIGNLVAEGAPVSDDEANNVVARRVGTPRTPRGLGPGGAAEKLYNHVDLVLLLGIADLEKGAEVAGSRGYYLKNEGVLLNQALINYALAWGCRRGYAPVQTPFFMQKGVMAECAQLAQFDEELYKVRFFFFFFWGGSLGGNTLLNYWHYFIIILLIYFHSPYPPTHHPQQQVTGEGEEKYLIATAEQTLCALHRNTWLEPAALPLRYVGYSTCFRKEAGSHGRDTLGIFRVHQFEKVGRRLGGWFVVIAVYCACNCLRLKLWT